MGVIINNGTYADQQRALLIIGESEIARGKSIGPTNPIAARWGGEIPTGDCAATPISIGQLSFIAHDFGEWLKVPIGSARMMEIESGVDGGHRVAILLAARMIYEENRRCPIPRVLQSRDRLKNLDD